MNVGLTIKRMSERLPAYVFSRLLEAIISHHQISELADAMGCSTELIRQWSKSLNPDGEVRSKILAYAFSQCRETEEILTEVLNEVGEVLEKLKTSKRSEKLDHLMASVDAKSRLMIEHFLRNRYAGIRELAELIHADSDMEVLIQVKEAINPKAQEILGFPLLSFKLSKIDPATGEKIGFSWWLAEGLNGFIYDEILDIFNEKDQIRVITCPPANLSNVVVEVKGDSLILSGEDYYREIPLLYSVEKIGKMWNNGVLEVRLKITGGP